jgi:hypothetical protein
MITENFCLGMMVTQLVLASVFVGGVLFLIGHQISEVIKK